MEQAEASWARPTEDAHNGASPPAHEAMQPKRSLASLLEKEGLTADQIREAFVEGVSEKKRLGEVVVTRGLVDELGLARTLARQWDLELADPEELAAGPLADLPLAQAQALSACVIAHRDGVPVVAVADPTAELFAAVEEELSFRPSYRVTTGSALKQLIVRLAGAEAELQATPVPATTEPLSTPPQPEMLPLLRLFDDTVSRLRGFRDQHAELAQAHDLAINELADCRGQLARFSEQRSGER